MTQTAHTPGIWHVYKEDVGEYPVGNGLTEIGTAYRKADADLFAEAGTVANKTGLTPRQLADQRAELLGALRDIVSDIQAGRTEWETNGTLAYAIAAIAKAEGRA